MKKKKKERLIGCKVLKRVGKKLVSCTNAGLKVVYRNGVIVSPRLWGGPLTLFTTIETAKSFADKLKDKKAVRIYEAEYLPTVCASVWRYRNGGLKSMLLADLPRGTVLSKGIKLVKKIA